MSIVEVCFAVFLLALLQRFIFRRFWKNGLFIELKFSSDTAVEGDTVNLTETLTNRKILPLPWVAAKFQVSRHLLFKDVANSQVSDDYYRNDLFSVMMFQRITRTLPFVCGKRGFYRIKSVDLVSNDMLYTQKLYSLEKSDARLTVYPRLIDVDEFAVPYKKISGNILARRFINPDPFEFKGIREYQSYDSFKTINFKASAKTGRYMVNMYDYTVAQEIVILPNLQKYSAWVSLPLFEKSIRLAASLADHYAKEGVPVALVSNGRDVISGRHVDIKSGLSGRHLDTIYDALARIDLDAEAAPIMDYTRDYGGPGQTDRVYILISTYTEPDLAAEFTRLKELGSDALWIIPAEYATKIYVELGETGASKIVKWEAGPDE